ncbi:5-bromo-4-chloroindolyl phosphate hydrolysis family protein [Clostridium sp.]|uniref:5-bromo-4-chloroindolyl phosphate hydrolysis family protein n=1 Tax=Clostridium sp. TaxID=1506 RepID=UPI003F36B33D
MNKNDFYNLEEQITSTVSDALKAIDIAGLKSDISYNIDDTINQFKLKFNLYIEKHMNLNKKAKNHISNYINKRPPGSVSSIIYIVVGSGVATINITSLGVYLIANSVFSSIMAGSGVVLGVLVVFSLGGTALFLKGINERKRIKRFKKYVRIIDDNSFVVIEELAKYASEKKNFVIKDLRKMIDLGMFIEGHIDEAKTYFMINDEVYGEYLNLKKEQIDKENNKKKLKKDNNDTVRDEVDSTIKIGREYIGQIKTIRNQLQRDEICIKLDKLGDIANQILNKVEENPKKVQEVNKFINHYLPMTIKLISSYKELNNQVVQGYNIKNAKDQIKKSIDLINSAFENLLDDLYEDVVLDISTDITVLKTLFKQEGLGEEDFKK